MTPREREVLALKSEGLTSAEIAARLKIAAASVTKHLENAHEKLECDPASVADVQRATLGRKTEH